MSDIKICFMLFVIYSFIGWLIEVIRTLTSEKKFINRGFLIGPYCPIYGFGCISIITISSKITDKYVLMFILSVLICGILEYLTSYFMELIFKIRWWNYSNEILNINGRICVRNLIIFGFGGYIICKINPYLLKIINIIPTNIINYLSIILFSIIIIDLITSFQIIIKFDPDNKTIYKDSTEDISKHVKNFLIKLNKRLIYAFPNIFKIANYKKNK